MLILICKNTSYASYINNICQEGHLLLWSFNCPCVSLIQSHTKLVVVDVLYDFDILYGPRFAYGEASGSTFDFIQADFVPFLC
jgi:hypothetical protein